MPASFFSLKLDSVINRFRKIMDFLKHPIVICDNLKARNVKPRINCIYQSMIYSNPLIIKKDRNCAGRLFQSLLLNILLKIGIIDKSSYDIMIP